MGGTNLVIQDLRLAYERHKAQMFNEIIVGETVHSPDSELSCLPVEIRVRWMEEGWECVFASLEAGEPLEVPSSFMPSSGEVGDPEDDGLLHDLMLITHRTAEFVSSLCPYLVQDFEDDPEYLSSLLLMLGRGAGMYTQSFLKAYLKGGSSAPRGAQAKEDGASLRAALSGTLAATQAAAQKTRRALGKAMKTPKGPTAGSLSEVSCDLAAVEARLEQMAETLRQTATVAVGTNAGATTESPSSSPGQASRQDLQLQAIGDKYPFGKSSLSELTSRQTQIAQLVALGYTNKRIAKELSLSPNTVRNHIASILETTGLKNRSQIASTFAQLAILGTK